MGDATAVVSGIRDRLSAGPFRVIPNVKLAYRDVDLVASRGYLSWKGLVFQSQHIFCAAIAKPDRTDFEALFTNGYQHAKRNRRVPWPRGLQYGFMILPVIVADEISQDVVGFVTSQPKKRFSIFEFPVAIDAATGTAHCFRKTAAWGAFYFKDLRTVVDRYLAPGLSEPPAPPAPPAPPGS